MTKNIEFTERGIKLPPHIVDDLTRREFLIGAGLLTLVPGCGSDGEESSPSGETRTVEHELGTTEVPVSPERVVALFGPTLAGVAMLGVEVAGSTGYETSGDHSLNYYVPEDVLEDLEFVGIQGQPNIERVAVLEPDLIMGIPGGSEEEVYERLSEIAPTVLLEYGSTGGWRIHFDRIAAAVGKEEEGLRIVDDYQSRAEEVGRRIGDPGEIEVSLIEWGTENFRVRLDNSFGGSVLQNVGLSRPESQIATGDEEFEDFVEYSFEDISEADADVILVASYDEETTGAFADFQNNPLWENLSAVRNGRVYEVEGHVWGGSNYYSANLLLLLDDLERIFLEGGS